MLTPKSLLVLIILVLLAAILWPPHGNGIEAPTTVITNLTAFLLAVTLLTLTLLRARRRAESR